MARSSIGLGCQPLTLARRVRFPHGLLNMTMWWNWQTCDGQNVVPLRRGSSTLPMVTETLQARQVPNWLSYGRCARLDTGACNLQVGQCSTESHKLCGPGATPGPATYDRVRKLA